MPCLKCTCDSGLRILAIEVLFSVGRVDWEDNSSCGAQLEIEVV